MPDLMETLVDHLVDTNWEDLPARVIEDTKKNILDTLGCIVAGSSAAACGDVAGLVKEWGGKPECSVSIYGGKVPAPLAALANATMARARDMGNTHMRANVHPSEYVLPPALAMAERQGSSGKDFLLAVALGEDILCRIGNTLNVIAGVSGRYNMFRIFGPTAAGARLLGLDKEKSLMAMGLAYMQAGGDMQAYKDGALSVRVQQGLVGDAALKSVFLAERGVTGSRNILQGPFGFYNAYEPDHDLAALTENLGQVYEGTLSAFKPYPCCACTHASISATLELVEEHNILPDEVEDVEISVDTQSYNLVAEPRELKTKPRFIVDAQFSVPFTVARAIVNRDVFIADFTEETIRDERTLELAAKVAVTCDKQKDGRSGSFPAEVRIRTSRGEFYRRVDFVKGSMENPMSMEDIVVKFRKCVAFSARPMSDQTAEHIIEAVVSLERLDNVARLAELLVLDD